MTATGRLGTRDRNSGIVGAALLPLASTGRHADRAEWGVGARQTVVDWRQAAGFAKGSDCRVELVHHNQPGGVVDRCPVDRAHKTNQLRGLQVSQVFEHAEQLTQRNPVRSCEPARRDLPAALIACACRGDASIPSPRGATTPRDLWAPAGSGLETYPQPPADRSLTSRAGRGLATRPAERTGTRRQGAAAGALAYSPRKLIPSHAESGLWWLIVAARRH